jgi:16S rRNA (cytosine1407-C5)-methyltransferase
VQSLRVGGVLVYSTCSFAPEENEAVVSAALAEDDRLSLDPIALDVTAFSEPLTEWDGEAFEGVSNARRIVPDGTFEAFFVARIRKAV